MLLSKKFMPYISASTVQKDYICEDQQHSVPKSDVCNGFPDCPDGSDELYCIGGIPIDIDESLMNHKPSAKNISSLSQNVGSAQSHSHFTSPAPATVKTLPPARTLPASVTPTITTTTTTRRPTTKTTTKFIPSTSELTRSTSSTIGLTSNSLATKQRRINETREDYVYEE